MIQVLKRSLSVLEYLARQRDRLSAPSDIARATGLHAATCGRILGTLMSEGYVEQEGCRKGYRLGPTAYMLSAHCPYRKDLVSCAEPLVQQLSKTTRESVIVAVIQHHARYTLCRAEGSHKVQVRIAFVLRDDPAPYATGRLLLAYLPPAELDAYIAHVGLPDKDVWPAACTRQGLLAELASLKSKSDVISVVDGEIMGLALPIWNANHVAAALGIYLPTSRYSGEHKELIHKEMKATASAISMRLTDMHTPPGHGGKRE
jgi:DNA-binding IclR family transcriptional regulator